jgi:hypothetical protein
MNTALIVVFTEVIMLIIRWFTTLFQAKPLDGLVITDFDILVPYADAVKNYGEEICDADAYDTMVKNCTKLRQYGASVDKNKYGHYVPFKNVSGIKCNFPGIMYPADIVGGEDKLGMLLWGSPHPCLSSNVEPENETWVGTLYHNHTPKTEAFEMMAWLAPLSIIVMTFSNMYRCEFYQPQWSPESTERHLIVASAYMKVYTPMRSSSVKIDRVSDNAAIMVAMLVPYQYVHCVIYTKDGKLAFADTMRMFLRAIKKDNKRAVALGAYIANLEAELIA